MEKKKKLKGRKERIIEDWTWKERKIWRKLEEVARREMGKGRKVWIGYGAIKIEDQCWRWDKNEGILKDGKGNPRENESGKRQGGEEVKKGNGKERGGKVKRGGRGGKDGR